MAIEMVRGFSDADKSLQAAFNKVRNRHQDTVTFSRQPELGVLWEAWQACKEPNWDGEDAVAVSQEAYRTAYQLIENLPFGYPAPTITAEPDGHINLEWYKSPRRLLNVSVSSEEVLYWAALIGSEDPRGTCQFFAEIPKTLLYWIGRVYKG